MNLEKITYLIIISILISACTKKSSNEFANMPDSSLTIIHAKGFSIEYYSKYKKVTVKNPWEKDTVYARYYLVNDLAVSTPENGQKIQVPIQSIGAASATQYEFLHLIGNLNSITGICSPKLIYNKQLLAKIRTGKLTDMGDPFSLNIERVQLLNPDAVMISGFKQEDPVSKRLIEAGIPVLFNNEWMETSLLARAEWIKFAAVFFNKELLADSIFNKITKSYEATKYKAIIKHKKPSVMVGGNFKGTWYMPGGRSYMAGLLMDAGANYYYSFDTNTGSLPLNFEMVLHNFQKAEVWIGSSANSMKELLSIDERHGLFDAAKNKQVYNFNKRTTTTGGNDFWESGVAHPDVILADMIKVFHPELMREHEFVYVNKLN